MSDERREEEQRTEGVARPTDALPKPVRVFDRAAPWVGLLMMVAMLYYDLERGIDVNELLYAIPGALMGLGAALRQAIKP